MKAWSFLGMGIVGELLGSLSLKGGLTEPIWYIGTALGYSAAFVFLSLTLRTGMPLGVAYGVWSAIGVMLTAMFAALVFGEQITVLMGVGMLLVMIGVVMVEAGLSRAAPEPTAHRQKESA